MSNFTPHQKKIIDRYYNNRDQILLTRLQELVTDIFLAETPKKLDQLWKRAASAMESLKVPPRLAEHILAGRDPKVLAANVQNWLKKPPAGSDSKASKPTKPKR